MVKLTKGYRGALAAAACSAMFIGTVTSASAVTLHAAAAKVVAVTPAKKADDAAAKAADDAKKADAVAKQAAEEARRAAAAVAAAVAKAEALAAKTAAADAKKAATAAKKAADAAAKAVEKAKVLTAKTAAAEAKNLAAQKAAEAVQAAKAAAKAAKAAQVARDAQATKEAKAAAAIPGAPLQLTAQRSPVTLNDFTVSWTAPTGKVKRYVVTVYADGTKTLYPVTTRSLAVKGSTLQSEYRIEVASQDAHGNGATSIVVLAPATPGEPTDLTTRAVSATSGVSMSWLPPVRTGVAAVDMYRVRLVDLTSGATVSLDTAQPSAVFAGADPSNTFVATITAVNPAGESLPLTVKIGDLTSTIPTGFTAIRDPFTPTEVNLSWSTPVWQAFKPVTDYEVGIRGSAGTVWTSVGLTENFTVTLPLDKRATYYIRAINASGPSPADDSNVNLGVKTQLPSSGAPVVLSAGDNQVDIALYGWIGGTATDHLVVTVTGTTSDYRSEQVTANGKDGVAFRDLANGVYTVTVVGHDSETGNQIAVYDGTITSDDSGSESSVEASFDAAVGYWRGIYPTRHLPQVTSSKDVFFDGTGSMAIKASWDSRRSNISVGTNGFGGIPVNAKQAVVVSAMGRPGAVSDWNVGISWWDANGKQISIGRSKRMIGVVNTWKLSRSTFTAPTGAVSATAFVEIGGMLKGETFYVDGITLQSK